ncbi:hypothetical protein AVEN_102297-1 [Araneus ventricosus]|uniref:Uncharacterized protein n=1 Tax=Araneus ventricosus TaxID=182803 RepID=A0A4Y2IFW1_ARAVE|nr:hypothetical protein AVEN_102297-1 [Araneus ventricosus]
MFNVRAVGHHPHIPTVISFRPVHHRSTDAFQQCLQRCCHWGYINFDFHITPQEEITWCEIWRTGGYGNRGTSSRSAILYSGATGLPSGEHTSHESGL